MRTNEEPSGPWPRSTLTTLSPLADSAGFGTGEREGAGVVDGSSRGARSSCKQHSGLSSRWPARPLLSCPALRPTCDDELRNGVGHAVARRSGRILLILAVVLVALVLVVAQRCLGRIQRRRLLLVAAAGRGANKHLEHLRGWWRGSQREDRGEQAGDAALARPCCTAACLLPLAGAASQETLLLCAHRQAQVFRPRRCLHAEPRGRGRRGRALRRLQQRGGQALQPPLARARDVLQRALWCGGRGGWGEGQK